jgi:hypothetical protein
MIFGPANLFSDKTVRREDMSSAAYLAFYNVGTVWAHEVDIFRSWKLIDPKNFHEIQRVHWRKLPYWIFAPVGLALLSGSLLIWYHPANSPLTARSCARCYRSSSRQFSGVAGKRR